MEHFVYLLIGFISLSFTGWNVNSADIKVTVEPESITVHSGDAVMDRDIVCHAELPMQDLINTYRLNWISPDGKTLNRFADNQDGVPEEKYVFHISSGNGGISTILTMTIKDFDGGDVGTYLCELSAKSSGDPMRSSAEFRVEAKYDIESLKMRIDELEFDNYIEDPIQLAENTYTVVCLSKGSNPPAHLSLTIHSAGGQQRSVPSPLTVPSFPHMEGKVETFEVKYKQSVGLREDDDRITCKAEVPTTDFGEKRVSVGLQILPVEPVFECDNASAEVGEENVLISCRIISYHPMKDHKWFEGNNENVISRNVTSLEDNLVHIEEKNEEKDGKFIISTSVEIRQAQSYLFNTLFYLEVEAHQGEFYRHAIKLKKDYTSSSSTTIYSSVLVLFVAILLTFVSQ